jgi:hypothetical protein
MELEQEVLGLICNLMLCSEIVGSLVVLKNVGGEIENQRIIPTTEA